MGKKRKRQESKPTWKLQQPNGPPQSFSVSNWGGATADYMVLLEDVPADAMQTILHEARLVANGQKKRTSTATVQSRGQGKRAALRFR